MFANCINEPLKNCMEGMNQINFNPITSVSPSFFSLFSKPTSQKMFTSTKYFNPIASQSHVSPLLFSLFRHLSKCLSYRQIAPSLVVGRKINKKAKDLVAIDTDNQLGDQFTKGLPEPKFVRDRKRTMGR